MRELEVEGHEDSQNDHRTLGTILRIHDCQRQDNITKDTGKNISSKLSMAGENEDAAKTEQYAKVI